MEFEKREKRNMSQAQINRHKKIGAHLTEATSVLGLGSLAALGGVTAAPKLARAGRLGKVTEAQAKTFKDTTKNKLITGGIVSQGVSGINGLNNAAWQGAEARQRKQKVVVKNFYGEADPGCVGEIAKRISDEDIEKMAMPKMGMPKISAIPGASKIGAGVKEMAGAAKQTVQGFGSSGGTHKMAGGTLKPKIAQAQSFIGANKKPLIAGAAVGGAGVGAVGMGMNNKPKQAVVKAYDPEGKRMKRADNYQRGADVVAGVAGATALGSMANARDAKKAAKPTSWHGKQVVDAKALKAVRLNRRAAGYAAAVGGGALYAHHKIGQKKSKDGDWSPYVSKSAFGIPHD